MKNEIQTEDVKALLKFIVAGYFFDVLSKEPETEKNQLAFNISVKDKEVLKMVADGMSDEEIASKLLTTTKTVTTKIDEIFSKLENKERTKEAVFALKNQMFAL